jgi:hypothetical protein
MDATPAQGMDRRFGKVAVLPAAVLHGFAGRRRLP